MSNKAVCRTAPATPGLLIINLILGSIVEISYKKMYVNKQRVHYKGNTIGCILGFGVIYAVLSDFAKCRDSRIKSAPRVLKIEGGGFSQFGQCPYLDCFS